jgi:hypothetical protein
VGFGKEESGRGRGGFLFVREDGKIASTPYLERIDG